MVVLNRLATSLVLEPNFYPMLIHLLPYVNSKLTLCQFKTYLVLIQNLPRKFFIDKMCR